MIRHRPATVALLAILAAASAHAQTDGADAMKAAVRTDELTVPTPGEFFAAINKAGKPAWNGQFREPIPTNFSSRAQLALNLGSLVADGYIAVEAQDGQQVKNIGRDIMAMAKGLGVSEKVISRGNSITGFAENNEWDALKEELEATQNEVKKAMQEQQDQDLVILVTLGAWIRGTEVASSVIAGNHSADAAKLLRQPALAGYLREKIDRLSPKLLEDPLLQEVKRRLAELEALVTFPAESAPAVGDVQKIHESAAALVALISRK